MINLETLKLEEYPISALEIKQTTTSGLFYFSVYQLLISGVNDFGKMKYTNPNLFLTKELCEKFWKEEIEPEIIKNSCQTGFEINVKYPYKRKIKELRVYLK